MALNNRKGFLQHLKLQGVHNEEDSRKDANGVEQQINRSDVKEMVESNQ